MKPYFSIVVPVYNEAGNLCELIERISNTLRTLERFYEIILVNDGSQDESEAILKTLYEQDKEHLRIINFAKNFGQHPAIMAGFAAARGDLIITLDADLQNPPEEIPKLVALAEKGYDLVSGVRLYARKDNWFRRIVSIIVNYIREKITNIHMTDHGCMLRTYHRSLILRMLAQQEISLFIPALAYRCAINPTEVDVVHAARAHGDSKYSLLRLIKLNFDLMTGYSLVPLQIFSLLGTVVSTLSVSAIIWALVSRTAATFRLIGYSLICFCLGLVLIGIGTLGEYLGRIYQGMQRRPLYIIKNCLGDTNE